MSLSKLKAITVLAAASATISVSAVAATYIDVRVAPPPPRHEMVPAARPGYVWAPGYWDWTRPPPRLGEWPLGARASRLRVPPAEVGAERQSLALLQQLVGAR